MARLSKSRSRELGSIGSGKCVRMAICDKPERGSARCGKNRCNWYKDPRNPKNRIWIYKGELLIRPFLNYDISYAHINL